MSLARRCSPSFTETIRRRGRALFRSRMVTLVGSSQTSAEAQVWGSSGNQYRVLADWLSWSDRLLLASCDCPYFGNVDLCKHLWALLLQLEEQGIGVGIRGRGAWRVERLADVPAHRELEPEDDSLRYGWLRQLDSLRPLDPAAAPELGSSELYLIHDPQDGFRDGGIEIQFARRDRLRSGQLGKLKNTRLVTVII